MPLLLVLTTVPAELDPRAQRQLAAARVRGLEIATADLGLGVGRGNVRPEDLLRRELRGILRIVRLALRTRRLTNQIRRHPRADVVHANDFETLPAAVLGGRRSRIVYDAHELYAAFEPRPPRLYRAALLLLERWLARRADAVVTVSDALADELARRHALRRRPLVVLNCPPLTEVAVEPRTTPPRAIYQAATGPGRNLEDLAEAAGSGVQLAARILGPAATPPGVHRLDPVGPEELVHALAPFDIGLVIDRPETENARLALPNKLFEYLMAGLAVLVPRSPAMQGFVEEHEVGLAYEQGRIADALRELASDRPRLDEMRRRARALAVERYNAEAQRPALYAAWGL